MPKDTQSRKWLLTINNPLLYGFEHNFIKSIISSLTSVEYWCMSDEIGVEEETLHTHIFLYSSSAIRFSSIKNKFPVAHIDCCKGTCRQNRDYICKEGKYKNDPKTKTSVEGSFEEYGEIPVERQGVRNDLNDLYDMIVSGMTNAQILSDSPQYLLQIDKIDRVRQSILSEKWRTVWRDVEVIYIYGSTRTGKTRFVMDLYGYENVYRVTDYHNPFDSYKCQDVILFDEFRSSLKIEDMLKYLEGYPIELPSRYFPKQACFSKAYIISNISLSEQYRNIQREQPETWKAFCSRIGKVIHYSADGSINEMSVKDSISQVSISEMLTIRQYSLPFD